MPLRATPALIIAADDPPLRFHLLILFSPDAFRHARHAARRHYSFLPLFAAITFSLIFSPLFRRCRHAIISP
jgi:hypothetical protein